MKTKTPRQKQIFHSILTIIHMVTDSAAIIYTHNPKEINLAYKSPTLAVQTMFLILKIFPLIHFPYNTKDRYVKYEMLVYLPINVFLAVLADNLKKVCRNPPPDHLDQTLRKLFKCYSTITIKIKIKGREFTALLDTMIMQGSTSLPSTCAAELFFAQYVLDLIYSKRYKRYGVSTRFLLYCWTFLRFSIIYLRFSTYFFTIFKLAFYYFQPVFYYILL